MGGRGGGGFRRSLIPFSSSFSLRAPGAAVGGGEKSSDATSTPPLPLKSDCCPQTFSSPPTTTPFLIARGGKQQCATFPLSCRSLYLPPQDLFLVSLHADLACESRNG